MSFYQIATTNNCPFIEDILAVVYNKLGGGYVPPLSMFFGIVIYMNKESDFRIDPLR